MKAVHWLDKYLEALFVGIGLVVMVAVILLSGQRNFAGISLFAPHFGGYHFRFAQAEP